VACPEEAEASAAAAAAGDVAEKNPGTVAGSRAGVELLARDARATAQRGLATKSGKQKRYGTGCGSDRVITKQITHLLSQAVPYPVSFEQEVTLEAKLLSAKTLPLLSKGSSSSTIATRSADPMHCFRRSRFLFVPLADTQRRAIQFQQEFPAVAQR
jgi:hypothetical protein